MFFAVDCNLCNLWANWIENEYRYDLLCPQCRANSVCKTIMSMFSQ